MFATATTVLQYGFDSIAYGSLFALIALSLSLLFGVMGLMNFAYGELIMAGAFTMFYTRTWGVIPMIAVTFAIVVVLAVLMERLAFRPVRRGSPVTLLITSFAVSYGLQQLAFMTVGKSTQQGVTPYPWTTRQHDVLGVLVSNLEIITAVTTVLLLIAMTLMLKRTSLGVQLRASTEDFGMAQLVGVKANRVIAFAFAITGFLAAAVTVLYVLRSGAIAPTMGQGPLLIAFVGGVIGGLGSLSGAAFGGFVLGFLINLLQAALPTSLNGYTLVFAFLAVIAILVWQPDGMVVTGRRIRARWRRRREAASAEPVATGELA
ncbi:High-affinity branched-chain amino acid transport system permease protein LivH [Capillimicrobium parvum]|uniref:High-affinity branched-chain amino acid transport system permease protein LivH n=2 Tax=Capillimicrobium parvum TaxID=2884022 RepID=A0A9E6XYU5_9ACTN|nr:High-affinity branched-chain amino acid transport system permease protein LivH [Capillimicrobium parvum]